MITQNGSIAAGNCLKGSSTGVQDAGAPCVGPGANTFTGLQTLNGGVAASFRTITATGGVTVGVTDYFICIKKTASETTAVVLPASPGAGQTFVVKDCKGDAATNATTVTASGGALIDTASSYVIGNGFGSAAFTWDGSAYWVN